MATITEIAGTKQQKKILRTAAYCRVSSDSLDQLHSFAAQVQHYTKAISQNPSMELADIYADEGLTGTKTDKRDDFNRLIADCRKGKIDGDAAFHRQSVRRDAKRVALPFVFRIRVRHDAVIARIDQRF